MNTAGNRGTEGREEEGVRVGGGGWAGWIFFDTGTRCSSIMPETASTSVCLSAFSRQNEN